MRSEYREYMLNTCGVLNVPSMYSRCSTQYTMFLVFLKHGARRNTVMAVFQSSPCYQNDLSENMRICPRWGVVCLSESDSHCSGCHSSLGFILTLNAITKTVSENLALKQGIFRSLSAELSPKTILASNTSSISITKIAASTIPEGKTASDPEGQASTSRVVGLHFFNPVPVMVCFCRP